MKKILFLTGTRADFGKLKSLIANVNGSLLFESLIFVTGMHMQARYGMTSIEVERSNLGKSYNYINQNFQDTMDVVLSKTISGLSDYVKETSPDLIVVHGDRVEALAGSIVGALNNILVAHIEGGEVSGTIDELIRHSVTKMSHVHFVSNVAAKSRLKQLGEKPDSIYVIGSPDLDIMTSRTLPTFDKVREKYDINFNGYHILMYHPVTTELSSLENNIRNVVDAVESSNENFVVIYPNNDHGTEIILKEYERLKSNVKVKIFPSVRFEYFLTLLKHSISILGNSSAGVREMPFYGLPSINLGNRQNNRAKASSIINISEDKGLILDALSKVGNLKTAPEKEFGNGNSSGHFLKILETDVFWQTPKQKVFIDL